ncbi:MAG: hypothetical protein QW764_04935 [Desulfurococcaceae archaeon]
MKSKTYEIHHTGVITLELPLGARVRLYDPTTGNTIAWLSIDVINNILRCSVELPGRVVSRELVYSEPARMIVALEPGKIIYMDCQNKTYIANELINFEHNLNTYYATIYTKDVILNVISGSVRATEVLIQTWTPSLDVCNNLLQPPQLEISLSALRSWLSYFANTIGCSLSIGYIALLIGVALISISSQLMILALQMLPFMLLVYIVVIALTEPHRIPEKILNMIELGIRLIRVLVDIALKIINIIVSLLPF